MEGFKTVFGYPTYSVNKDGIIYDNVLRRNLKITLSTTGYPVVHLRNNSGKPKRTLVHRILALAFIPNNRVDRVMVNHIDGNKLNYSLDNLEWATCSENTIHAYKTGLRTSLPETSTAVFVRNIKTLVVTFYKNASDAARALGIGSDSVIGRARSCGQRTWPDNNQYKFKSNSAEWADPDLDFGIGKNRRVQARNLLTNEVHEFSSQREAAKFFKLCEAKISTIMVRENPVMPGKWQLRYATVKEWLPIDDYYEQLEACLNGRCCVIWNDIHAFVYETCIEGANALKISPTAFNYRLSTSGKSSIKGFRYAYYSDYKKINPGRL